MADTSIEHGPELTETQARSGFRGLHVLWMLIISVGLAIIALALAWGYRAHDLKIIQASSAQRISASQPAAAPRPREATTNYLP